MVLRAADININDARQRRRRRRRRRRSVRVGRRTHRTEHERACHHQRHASSSNARRRRRRRRRAHVRPKGAELCRSVSRFKTDPCEQRRVMNRHTLDGIQSKKCTCMRKQYQIWFMVDIYEKRNHQGAPTAARVSFGRAVETGRALLDDGARRRCRRRPCRCSTSDPRSSRRGRRSDARRVSWMRSLMVMMVFSRERG